MNETQFEKLILQMLETEKGGVKVYEAALRCASNEDLKKEWQEYYDQTRRHVEIVTEICGKFGIDPDKDSPGRGIVRSKGEALVGAMETALGAGDPSAAQIVACECVVDAETKDHMNWELFGECMKELDAEKRKAVKDLFEEVEEQEDEHLYHTKGWCRELWIESFGLPAVLPPPEEEKDVTTAIGAERAKQSRGRMAKKSGGARSSGRRGSKKPPVET